jgi:hypothetical protein
MVAEDVSGKLDRILDQFDQPPIGILIAGGAGSD